MQPVHFQSGDLIEPRAFEHALCVPRMNIKCVEASGFRIGVQRNFIGLARAEFADHDSDRPRSRGFERDFYFQFLGLSNLPSCLGYLALLVSKRDDAYTASIGRAEMQSILAADNQSAGVFGGDNPLSWRGAAQPETRALKRTKAPTRAQNAADLAFQLYRLHGFGIDHKTAAPGIGNSGKIYATSRLGFDMKDKVMG